MIVHIWVKKKGVCPLFFVCSKDGGFVGVPLHWIDTVWFVFGVLGSVTLLVSWWFCCLFGIFLYLQLLAHV